MQNQTEQVLKLPVTIMRGGTSKGIYILESDLPNDHKEWDSRMSRCTWGYRELKIGRVQGSM